MDKVIEMKSRRFKFLKMIYELTGGSESTFVSMWDMGVELCFSRNDTELIVQYLVGEHLVKHVAIGGRISITHLGIIQVETALQEPDKATQYFPPANIINIHNMVGSQIQQGTDNSTQTGTFSITDIEKVKNFIDEISTKVSDFKLNNEDKDELIAEIDTVKAQTSSTRPKHIIIKESLKTIRSILEGLTSSILATELLKKLYSIIS